MTAVTEELLRDRRKEAIAERLRKMDPAERANLIRLALPRIVEPYTKHVPHPSQQVFLSLKQKEVMYGGAAGGGKSDALLMAALQYVDVPGYSALILRKTWPDLNAPGAILDRARTWLSDTDARPVDGGRIWKFPGGGRLQFGYMQRDADKTKFQSAEYQFIGFDELTHFEEPTYTYMFSRIRRPNIVCLNCSTSVRRYVSNHGPYWKHTTKKDRAKNCPQPYPDPAVVQQYGKAKQDGLTLWDVPLRMRSATNPGGVGHLWVKGRFIDEETKHDGSIFVPARLTDNPSLDQESYKEQLEHLLPIDRERLLNGDWTVQEAGDYFDRGMFNVVSEAPIRTRKVRWWDFASTDEGDWTVGALVHYDNGRWIIEDIVRFRGRPLEVEKRVLQTAMLDGRDVPIRAEQEPGSSGVTVISHYQRNILSGFNFKGIPSTGDKVKRAYPFASAAQAGNVDIVAGQWNKDFLDEVTLFPFGQNDDQVDAVSSAINELALGKRTRLLA